MRRHAFAAAVFAGAALSLAGSAFADVRITDQAYVRHDGGADATIIDCNNPATDPGADGAPPAGDGTPEGSSNRQQNEPTAAIDPLNTMHMTAGANDYCPVQTITDAWGGFYYSSDGGASWLPTLSVCRVTWTTSTNAFW